MANQFVHLHLHSEYSLQDSTVRLKPLMQQLRQRGMAAVALTDLSNMFAVVKHYKAAIAVGVKPIFGADVWINHHDRTEPLSRLLLLCLDDRGYLNLKRLVSRAYLEGQTADRPCIDIEWLREANQGLIALSACLEGDIGLAIKMQNLELAESCLQQWREIFDGRVVQRSKNICPGTTSNRSPQRNFSFAFSTSLSLVSSAPTKCPRRSFSRR